MVKQATISSFFGGGGGGGRGASGNAASSSSSSGDVKKSLALKKQEAIPKNSSTKGHKKRLDEEEKEEEVEENPICNDTDKSPCSKVTSNNTTSVTTGVTRIKESHASRRNGRSVSADKEAVTRRKRLKILEDSSEEEMDMVTEEIDATIDDDKSLLQEELPQNVLPISENKSSNDPNQEQDVNDDELDNEDYLKDDNHHKNEVASQEESVMDEDRHADADDDDDHCDDEEEEEEEDDDEKEDTAGPINKKSKIQSRFQSTQNGSSKQVSSGNLKNNAASSAAALLSSTESILSDKSCLQNCPIPYSVLCKTLSDIESISSRLEIQKHLTNLFRLCLLKNAEDLLTLVYLSSNSVAAAYECVELGIGDSILIKAIGEASGSNPSMIKQKYEADGDLGTVAMTAKGKQRTLGFGIKPKPLAAKEVLTVFRQIALTTGAQSQKWKINKIKGLLVRVQDPIESKYIIRGLQGKLRIGLAQSTVLISLAHAVLLSGPVEEPKDMDEKHLSVDSKNIRNKKLSLETRLESAVNMVKKAYSEVSSFDALVAALVQHPMSMLNEKCTLCPGIPVEPMLAKPTKSIQEVLKRLNGKRFTCEFKYDGERAQVHMDPNGVTKVFSRSLLDTSEKFPEVPIYVKDACENVNSFVLDTEVVAYNRETKQFVPFQVLSTRKKTEESDDNAKVKVIVQAFDLMYLNGRSLLDCPLSERRELLKKHFKAVDGKFQFATALDHTEDGDTTILEEFLDTAVKGQCEGLMVKTLDENASYQPSYRSLNWLKLKKDYLEGMGDSFDLVPIGAYHGKGKRTGVYGAYLLACYDVDTEEYQSVCKIGTGFSDEDLKNLSKGLNEKMIPKKSTQYNVSASLECDVWFEACQVWEVKAADLSKSSTHRGAVDKTGESSRGIGLRFPRFERLRDDKRPDQATTSDQILDMYYAQDSIAGGGGGGLDDDGY